MTVGEIIQDSTLPLDILAHLLLGEVQEEWEQLEREKRREEEQEEKNRYILRHRSN